MKEIELLKSKVQTLETHERAYLSTLTLGGQLFLKEIADPGVPSAGWGSLWGYAGGWLKYRADENVVLNLMPGADYTPSWTGTITNPVLGNGTLSGRVHVCGRMCFVFIHLLTGSTTTYGSGNLTFSLPYAARSGVHNYFGMAHFRDSGIANYERRAQVAASGTTIGWFVGLADGNNVNYWTPTSPWTIGSGDVVDVEIAYELSG